ncbi:acyltransferase family protein [Chitinophaga sp. G-6-1-13]|uniref:Acyltransferase family protein n=1 Tax=Chitinophaga fulva TaxID=2728842 RepID=A0A848GI67_9BACT|nr:acyltransferase family protein [Chitinophaga fulva]NML36603.1 acyltransferase family protein [Chitinophaga fulva]
MQPKTCRLAYLDWLRTLAILGIFLFTAARPFTPPATSAQPDQVNYMLNSSCIPLLFFLSGATSLHMALKRNNTKLILLWIRRLLAPLLTSLFGLLPLLIWLSQWESGNPGTFWSFYGAAVKLALHPANWYHLWVVICLALYMVMMIPLFRWLRTASARKFQQSLLWFVPGQRIFLLLLPVAAIFITGLLLGSSGHLVVFVYWWLLLVLGFFCMLQPELMDSLERNRRYSLVLLLIAVSFVIAGQNYHAGSLVALLIEPVHAGLWVFCLTGYGKKYLHREHRLRAYANLFVWPFYLLQQPLIIIIAGFVLNWQYPPVLEYIFVALSSWLLAIMIFNVLIKPFVITRFLFGVKPGTPPITTGKVVKVQMPQSEFFY